MHPFQIWDADHPYHITYLNLFPYSIDHLCSFKRFWPLSGIRSRAPPKFYAVDAPRVSHFTFNTTNVISSFCGVPFAHLSPALTKCSMISRGWREAASASDCLALE